MQGGGAGRQSGPRQRNSQTTQAAAHGVTTTTTTTTIDKGVNDNDNDGAPAQQHCRTWPRRAFFLFSLRLRTRWRRTHSLFSAAIS